MNKIVAVSVASSIATIAPAEATQVSDPIFAALDVFRRADADFYANKPEWGGDIPDEIGDRFFAAVNAVVSTRPTSPAGLAALTGWARDQMERKDRDDASAWESVYENTLVATIDDATRGMSGLSFWTPPTSLADVKISSPAVSSPTIKAIERYRKAWKRVDRCYDKLEEAKRAAKEKHGREPYALIHWRNYYVGGDELKRVREDFLRLGEIDPATIENEYLDAKKRYRAQVKAVKDWEKRSGLDGLCAALDQAHTEGRAAREALGVVEIQSVADASALLEWLRPEVKHGDIQPWEIAALNNASKFLKLAA